jgi:hypothetical protein
MSSGIFESKIRSFDEVCAIAKYRQREIAEQAAEIDRLCVIEEAARAVLTKHSKRVTIGVLYSTAYQSEELEALAKALEPAKEVPHEKSCASLNMMLLSDPPQAATCNCARSEALDKLILTGNVFVDGDVLADGFKENDNE